jgi:hypothetical protein
VWIRIRILDPDPAIFVIDFQDANIKLILKKVFLLFEGTFTSFFKNKKYKRSHKTVGIKVFLRFLLADRRIRIREAQKHVDPDSDPGLWYLVTQSFLSKECIKPKCLCRLFSNCSTQAGWCLLYLSSLVAFLFSLYQATSALICLSNDFSIFGICS